MDLKNSFELFLKIFWKIPKIIKHFQRLPKISKKFKKSQNLFIKQKKTVLNHFRKLSENFLRFLNTSKDFPEILI